MEKKNKYRKKISPKSCILIIFAQLNICSPKWYTDYNLMLSRTKNIAFDFIKTIGAIAECMIDLKRKCVYDSLSTLISLRIKFSLDWCLWHSFFCVRQKQWKKHHWIVSVSISFSFPFFIPSWFENTNKNCIKFRAFGI